MITEKELINKYLGTPFKHLGRSLDGLDCYGLLIMIYKDLEIPLIDMEQYDEKWAQKGENYFIENYHKQWEEVKNYRIFDVILFKNGSDLLNHIGIVLSGGKFIHSAIRAGTLINRITDPKWFPRIQGFYRFKNEVVL